MGEGGLERIHVDPALFLSFLFLKFMINNGSLNKFFTAYIQYFCPLTVFFTIITDHPWLQNAKKAPNVPLGDIVRMRLKQFSVMNRFKKKALRVSLKVIYYLLNY